MELQNYMKLIFLGSIFCLIIILSFHKRIRFYKKWLAILPPILITGVIFLFWDVKFATAGIWNLASDSNLSFTNFAIPLEELVFLFVFPFAGYFLFEVFKTSAKKVIPDNGLVIFSLILLVAFAFTTYIYKTRLYSLSSFMFTFAYLGYTIFRNKFKSNYYSFYLSFSSLLVVYVLYSLGLTPPTITDFHANHIIGLTLLSIPIENFVRLFLLLLMNFTLYEYFLVKRRN